MVSVIKLSFYSFFKLFFCLVNTDTKNFWTLHSNSLKLNSQLLVKSQMSIEFNIKPHLIDFDIQKWKINNKG